MEVKIDRGDVLTITLTGELDHHAAREVIRRLEDLSSQAVPSKCVLDMGGVGFMDSSGIAVVLGLYRQLKEVDSSLTVRNTPRQAMKVFDAAGVERIVSFI